jgi:chemotaxis protein MotB
MTRTDVTLLGVAAALALGLTGCCTDVETKLNGCVDRLAKIQSGIGDSARKAADLEQVVADLNRQLQREREQTAFLTSRLEALGQKVGAAASMSAQEKAALAKKLALTRQRLAEMEAARHRDQERLAKLKALLKRFGALIRSGRIKVQLRDGRMVVVLSSKVLFAPARTAVKPLGRKAIAEITAVLKAAGDRQFQVAGHTDNTPMRWGRYRSNWALSTARAVAVVQLMIKSGMSGKQLSAAGYGEFSPVKPNTTPANKAENRRIEIVLLPKLDELPDLKSLFEK